MVCYSDGPASRQQAKKLKQQYAAALTLPAGGGQETHRSGNAFVLALVMERQRNALAAAKPTMRRQTKQINRNGKMMWDCPCHAEVAKNSLKRKDAAGLPLP